MLESLSLSSTGVSLSRNSLVDIALMVCKEDISV